MGNIRTSTVNCSGLEDELTACRHDTTANCDIGEAAGVVCDTADYSLSLRGGGGPHEGNVYLGDRPVCDDQWDNDDSAVVCRQLGYYGYVRTTTENYFGTVGTVDYAMDDVACRGTEHRLTFCRHSKTDDCGGREAAGVVCDTREASVIAEENKTIDKFMDTSSQPPQITS